MAFARIRREIPLELRVLVLGLGILGVASMPVSWLLLEHWRWALVPQLQPMRALLFVALLVQFLTAAAGVKAAVAIVRSRLSPGLRLAYLLPLQPVVTALLRGTAWSWLWRSPP